MNFFPPPSNQGSLIQTLPRQIPNGFVPQIPPNQGSLIRTLPRQIPNGFAPQIPPNSFPREKGGLRRRKLTKSRKQSKRRRTKSVRHRRQRR